MRNLILKGPHIMRFTDLLRKELSNASIVSIDILHIYSALFFKRINFARTINSALSMDRPLENTTVHAVYACIKSTWQLDYFFYFRTSVKPSKETPSNSSTTKKFFRDFQILKLTSRKSPPSHSNL